MIVLVANLGSTSFKYRLFDMRDEAQLARGGVDRIGSAESRVYASVQGKDAEQIVPVADHGSAVAICLDQLADGGSGPLGGGTQLAAIGFKAVHAGSAGGVCRVDDALLDRMEDFNDVAPAHNPPYVGAMRQLRERFPSLPLVAAFETEFHRTIPQRNRVYATPQHWIDEFDVQRWGFHGASHRYIGGRMAQLLGRESLRIISCHLGGSSSLCAIRNGQSVATSLGMSPQSGIPHNNRVGDFDPFALPLLMRRSGKSLTTLLHELASQSGLLGMSGISGDVRDLEDAAADGVERAQLALDAFTSAIRHYLGAQLVELGGADVIAFTGGIGENSAAVRAAVCHDLAELGVVLDEQANQEATGEQLISDGNSRVAIWVLPTNEEIVVARLTRDTMKAQTS